MTSSDPRRPARWRTSCRALGKDVTLTVHPGSGHAFMSRHNALGTYDESLATRVWPDVISFLKDELD